MIRFNDIMLCSPKAVKDQTYVNYNVDDTLIAVAIRNAELRLEAIIGTRLMRRLKELVYNRLNNLPDSIDSADNWRYKLILDDFIKPTLVQMSVSELLTILSYKVRNTGVVKNADTNIQPVSYEEIIAMRNDNESIVCSLETTLSKFLKESVKDYAELTCKVRNFEKRPMLGKVFANSNLWLG